MKTKFVAVIASLLFAGFVPARSAPITNESAQLYMPDGQMQSHMIRVFINKDITESMKPELVLHGDHTLTQTLPWENSPIPVYRLSRNHLWMQKVDNQAMPTQGTLMLFNLQKCKAPPYKAMIRITPTLTWKEGDQTFNVIGENEVYLAYPIAAALWSGGVIVAIAIFIAFMSWKTTTGINRPPLARIFAGLANPDGSLSMWRAQLAAWTLAIGGVVFGFGLIRLEVPEIPETLIALMGLSLATGGLSAIKQPPGPDKKRKTAADDHGSSKAATTEHKQIVFLPMRLSDLVTNFNKETKLREVSVAKAQMVFWTILTLGIFLTKSITDGTLWPVPWQLVALMGMSQAGYVTPKFMPDQKRKHDDDSSH